MVVLTQRWARKHPQWHADARGTHVDVRGARADTGGDAGPGARVDAGGGTGAVVHVRAWAVMRARTRVVVCVRWAAGGRRR
jgi:hypothetical protein